jgi:hypothetical protein
MAVAPMRNANAATAHILLPEGLLVISERRAGDSDPNAVSKARYGAGAIGARYIFLIAAATAEIFAQPASPLAASVRGVFEGDRAVYPSRVQSCFQMII